MVPLVRNFLRQQVVELQERQVLERRLFAWVLPEQ
jgi:hypothetical protein